LKAALSPALSMNVDFNGMQPVRVCWLHSQLVVTTALILTFSPEEKGQRLQASLYAVVCRANPVAGAWSFRGSRREFVGGILSPLLEREKRFPLLSRIMRSDG
jgi:hypothetical protein